MYRKKIRGNKISCSNINDLFAKYFDSLDSGVLAECYRGKNPEKQKELFDLHCSEMDELQQMSFPYFLYGTVSWERKRRTWLSERLLDFLNTDCEHRCVDCFLNEASECRHPCCQQLAASFAKRCGVRISPPSSKKLLNKVQQKKISAQRLMPANRLIISGAMDILRMYVCMYNFAIKVNI